jgi:hypothetical protein
MAVSILPRATTFIRAMRGCGALAGGGDLVGHLLDIYGAGSAAANYVEMTERSAVASLNTSDDSALAPDSITGEFVDLVVEDTGLLNLFQRVPFNSKLPFDTSDAAAGWHAEGAPSPMGDMSLDTVTIRPKKVSITRVYTDELLRHSSPSADSIVRRKATSDVSAAVMSALLDTTNGGSSVKPASILYGLSSHDTFGGAFDVFEGDINRAVWLAHPQTWIALADSASPDVGIRGGTFRGTPAYASKFAPENALVLIDPSAVALAAGTMTFDASKNASVEMALAPTGNSTTPTATSTVVSLFQTDSTIVRLTFYVSWAITRPNSIVILGLDSPVELVH